MHSQFRAVLEEPHNSKWIKIDANRHEAAISASVSVAWYCMLAACCWSEDVVV